MITLWEAPFDTPLRVVSLGEGLENLRDLGIDKDLVITKLGEEIRHPLLLFLTPKGLALVAGGMSEKIIVEAEGKRRPATDLAAGDRARIVNFKGGKQFQESIALLGLTLGEEIQLKNFLPVMRYLCLVNDRWHLAITGGMAAKIWGRPDSEPESCQLPLAPLGKPFQVERILGGKKAQANLKAIGITPPCLLRLEGIEPLPAVELGKDRVFIIETAKGLRLHLDRKQAELIWVE
ncbi:MAG: ferrous iron transport protein A [Deltaproteobacteria bacterium]|nr:ferrous iron transport protein A [Deltaproteobacteria bacterium]